MQNQNEEAYEMNALHPTPRKALEEDPHANHRKPHEITEDELEEALRKSNDFSGQNSSRMGTRVRNED